MDEQIASFNIRDGDLLERNTLYTSSVHAWPIFFQGYDSYLEGDYKRTRAVFWDFKGNPIYMCKEKVAQLITKTTSEQMKRYIFSAKNLVDWLSTKEVLITQKAQRQAKCTNISKKADPLENRCCPN